MLQNKYVTLLIQIYGLAATYYFVRVARYMDTSSEGFHYKKVIFWTAFAFMLNIGLFLVATSWAQKYRKITVLVFLPTLLMVPQYFMLNGDGIAEPGYIHFFIAAIILYCFTYGGAKYNGKYSRP